MRDDSWNKTKRNDISGMDDMIDVYLHASSKMESLNQILISHVRDEFSYLRKSAEFIRDLLQRIPNGKDRGVYETHFVNKKIIGITPHIMYTDIVDAIIENNVYKILRPN